MRGGISFPWRAGRVGLWKYNQAPPFSSAIMERGTKKNVKSLIPSSRHHVGGWRGKALFITLIGGAGEGKKNSNRRRS